MEKNVRSTGLKTLLAHVDQLMIQLMDGKHATSPGSCVDHASFLDHGLRIRCHSPCSPRNLDEL